MKATITLTLKNDKTGEAETVVVTAATTNASSALFEIVTRLSERLACWHPEGWTNLHRTTRVTDCPSGFFPPHQQPAPEDKPHG